MGFEKIYITKGGSELAAKTIVGGKLEFDHVEIGSGTLTGDAKEKTELTKIVLSCDIKGISVTNETQAQITFEFKNTDASTAFYFREIGIFAIDPETKEKKLFAYANAGETAEYINNSITAPIQKVIDITIVVDNASNITITLDPEAAYPTKKEMEAAIKSAMYVTGKNYGVRRKIVDNTNPKWERIADNIGLIANATKNGDAVQNDFDNIYPWSAIKTYNYDTKENKVNAYIGDSNFKFDGSNGEVLTKIPEFWWKREVVGEYEYIYIADYARAGYKYNKQFSIGRYVIGLDAVGKAHSFSGLIPDRNKSIGAFRTLATAVGEKFCLLDTRYFILQILYLVEYAHYDSQLKLGDGTMSWFISKALLTESNVNRIIVTSSSKMYIGRNVSIGTKEWNSTVAEDRVITKIEDFNNGTVAGKAVYFNGQPVNIVVDNVIWPNGQKSGQCDELGMKSGTLNNDGCHSMIYRGIENILSNMWQFLDGINIKEYVAYICDDPTQYASDKFVAPYKAISYTNLQVKDVYTSRLGYDENNPEIAIPIEANGSTVTGTCDYYYTEAGNRVVIVGGAFNSGTVCGLFCCYCGNLSSYSSWGIGARLLKYQ